MTIDTGVGFAVALWALFRTFFTREGGQVAYLVDLLVCIALAFFIVRGAIA